MEEKKKIKVQQQCEKIGIDLHKFNKQWVAKKSCTKFNFPSFPCRLQTCVTVCDGLPRLNCPAFYTKDLANTCNKYAGCNNTEPRAYLPLHKISFRSRKKPTNSVYFIQQHISPGLSQVFLRLSFVCVLTKNWKKSLGKISLKKPLVF